MDIGSSGPSTISTSAPSSCTKGNKYCNSRCIMQQLWQSREAAERRRRSVGEHRRKSVPDEVGRTGGWPRVGRTVRTRVVRVDVWLADRRLPPLPPGSDCQWRNAVGTPTSAVVLARSFFKHRNRLKRLNSYKRADILLFQVAKCAFDFSSFSRKNLKMYIQITRQNSVKLKLAQKLCASTRTNEFADQSF